MSPTLFGDVVENNIGNMEQWVGSLAVVTGAAFGIGAEISTKLVKSGLTVVGLGKSLEPLEELQVILEGEDGTFRAKQCDITVEDDILETFRWIEDTLGPVSILINNASVLKSTSLKDGEIEVWKKTFDVNVLAVCICTREAINSMRKNEIDGHVVNVGSIAGHEVPDVDDIQPIFNVYPATKSALIAITETQRKELLRVNSKIKLSIVNPGITLPDLYNDYSSEAVQHLLDLPQLKSEDVANAIMYILGTPPGVQVQDLVIRAVGEKLACMKKN